MTPRAWLSGVLSNSEGNATVFSLFLLTTFLAVGSLAVDYASAASEQQHMQVVADAAALAAVHNLPDEAAARTAATNSAGLNAPAQRYGTVVAASSVTMGRWDAQTRVFQAGATPANAVSVTARRTKANGNAVSTYLMGLIGIDTLDVSARAFSVLAAPRCSGAAFLSSATVRGGSSSTYRDGFCVHGENAVMLGSGTTFEPGTSVGSRQRSNILVGSGSTGLDQALRIGSLTPTLPAKIPNILARLRAVTASNLAASGLPSYITRVETVASLTTTTAPTPGTLFIVNGNVNIGSGLTVENIAIVATGQVNFGSTATLRNVTIASSAGINIGSSSVLGPASTSLCATGTYSVNLISSTGINFGSSGTIRGTQMVSQGLVNLGSSLLAADGSYVETFGDINYGSGASLRGCPAGLISQLGGTALPGQVRIAL
jgi:Flp pilus assembly protein TadG